MQVRVGPDACDDLVLAFKFACKIIGFAILAFSFRINTCSSGRVYWWGLFPFHQRKKMIEKSQASLQQSIGKGNKQSDVSLAGGWDCEV